MSEENPNTTNTNTINPFESVNSNNEATNTKSTRIQTPKLARKLVLIII